MKEQVFKFRSSWYEAISELSEADQAIAYRVVMRYAYEGVEPSESDGLSNIVLGVFLVIRHQIDEDQKRQAEISAIRKACGKKGGRPRKPVAPSSPEPKRPKQKQMVSEFSVCSEATSEAPKANGFSVSQQAESKESTVTPAKPSTLPSEMAHDCSLLFPLCPPRKEKEEKSPITPKEERENIPPIIPLNHQPQLLRAHRAQECVRACEEDFCALSPSDASTPSEVKTFKEKSGEEVDSEQFLHYFNTRLRQSASKVPPLRSLQGRRSRSLQRLASQFGASSLLEATELLATSQFLNGHNRRGWIATFDWFVQPDNFAKILDSNYQEPFQTPPSYATRERSSDPRRGCDTLATSAEAYYTSF